jgi:rhamnogalacturonan acetylesterase
MRGILRRLASLLLVMTLAVAASRGAAAQSPAAAKPTLWLIGDSTVKNGHEDGTGFMWSWGTVLHHHFDAARVTVVNKALGGTSSRTFWNRPELWKAVADQIKPGDYVIMQFGHNDGGRVYNDAKARASLGGNGDNTLETTFSDGRKETVHTYGWYLRQMIGQAQAKGATPIVCSLIPRNDWTPDGKVARNQKNTYVKWAREAAQQTHAYFIDLNGRVADKYDKLGRDAVKPFFPNEHTHTGWTAAVINAQTVVEGIRDLKGPQTLATRLRLKKRSGCDLADYLLANPVVPKDPPVRGRPLETSGGNAVSRAADPSLFPQGGSSGQPPATSK